MNRKSLIFLSTLVNALICASVLAWLFDTGQTVQAQAPQRFLGPIYYGNAPVTGIFDHEYPMLSAGEDGDEYMRGCV